MNQYKDYEEKLQSHIVFAYNHLDMGDESFLGYDFVNIMDAVFSELHQYDRVTLALNSKGGNLAAGAKLIQLLRSHYKSYDVIVCSRCSSATTFVAMGADRLLCTENAMITPTEPQMEWNGKKISTAVIRNILEQEKNVGHLMQGIDWEILGNYFAVRSYFKDLCLNYLEKTRAEKVIQYMLDQVNSHQYPMTVDELRKLGLKVEILASGDLFRFVKESDIFLNGILKGQNTSFIKEKYIHLIMSSRKTEGYVKIYHLEKDQYIKIFEGFKEVSILQNQTEFYGQMKENLI